MELTVVEVCWKNVLTIIAVIDLEERNVQHVSKTITWVLGWNRRHNDLKHELAIKLFNPFL